MKKTYIAEHKSDKQTNAFLTIFLRIFLVCAIIFLIQELFWLIPPPKEQLFLEHDYLEAFTQPGYEIQPDWSSTIDIRVTAETNYHYNTRFSKGTLYVNDLAYAVSSKQFRPRSLLGHIIDIFRRMSHLTSMMPAEFSNYIFTSENGSIYVCISENDAQVYCYQKGIYSLYN